MTSHRRTIGPIRPVTPLRVVLLAGMAGTVLYSYRVNIDIDSFYCDVDNIGARGACAEIRDWITANTGIAVIQLVLSVLLCLTRAPSWPVSATRAIFLIATSAVLIAWVSVFFMDVSTYTRSVTFFNGRSGVVANLVVLLIALWLTRRPDV